MAKCPNCGKEIDHIDAWSLVSYHCPYCKEQIAWDEEEAIEILKKKA